jgi:hypothetical protein
MDNKPLETQAESLIQHKLIKHGLLVTKPSFDKEGTDLLIVKDISKQITPIIKVQCKGRTVKASSNVTIPIEYVEENFVVFLYVEEDESKDDFLYIFFYDDIKTWQNKRNKFQLAIPRDFRHKEYFKERIFTGESILKIEKILLKQAINQQSAKTKHSIVIDGIFLEQAVLRTQNIYKEIHPERILQSPSIDGIIEQLLKYTSVEYKEEVNCYLIYSDHFSLEYTVDIGEEEKYNLLTGEILTVGLNYNLFKLKTQDFVCFKVEKHIERIINTENVFLVADDFLYVPYLQKLDNRGLEMIIFQNSENAGTRMYHKFNWADITYPLALAMGLNQHEL